MLKSLFKHVLGIGITWVLVLVVTLLLLRWYSQPSAEREVPALNGLSKVQAKATLDALGLAAIWQDSIYALHGTPGSVVEQHPPAGSSVKVGRKVLLTTYRVTAPSELISVEEGQDAKIAERVLTTRGFMVSVEQEPNKLLVNKVIRVEHRGEPLSPADRLPRGTALTLVVGQPGAQDVRVPWLKGLSLTDAQSALSKRGLAIGHIGYDSSVKDDLDSSMAVVVSQDVDPRNQSHVEEGTSIDLYLGKY